jgi:uncharacterized membrane protein
MKLHRQIEETPGTEREASVMCIAQTADIFGTGIVAGAFYIGAIAIHPAAARLEASAQLLVRQEMIRRLQRGLPPFMLLPVVAVIAALVFCRTSVSWQMDALGCALSLATIAITVTVNAPLNRRFARWSPEALPSNWQQLIRLWDVAHWSRMATTFGAFVCAILAGN